MGLDTGIRGGRIVSVSPNLIVRVDNDGKNYKAISDLPPGTIVPDVRCTVATFGTQLKVISVHGTTVPVTIEPGRSPGSAPPQDSLTETAGRTVAIYSSGFHTIPIQDGLFSTNIVFADVKAILGSSEIVSIALASTTSRSSIDFYLYINNAASIADQLVYYQALGW